MLDGMITSAIAIHDIKGLGTLRNSRQGSVYIRQAEECTGRTRSPSPYQLFGRIEDALDLHPRFHPQDGHHGRGAADHGQPGGLQSAAAKDRVVFINTGFLDRTGDEIHTSMEARADESARAR